MWLASEAEVGWFGRLRTLKPQVGFSLGAKAMLSGSKLLTLVFVTQLLLGGESSSFASKMTCECSLLVSQAGKLRELDGGEFA